MMHYYHPLNKNGFGNNGMLGRSPKPWWWSSTTTHAVVIILLAGIKVAVNSWRIFDYYYIIKMNDHNNELWFYYVIVVYIYALLSFLNY